MLRVVWSAYPSDMASNSCITVFISFLVSQFIHISIPQAHIIGVLIMATIVALSPLVCECHWI